MKTPGLSIFISIVLFDICKSEENVSTFFTQSAATPSSVPVPVINNFTGFSQIVQDINIYQANIEEPEEQPTNEPVFSPDLLSSDVSPSSHHPETSQLPQISQSSDSEDEYDNKEPNSMNDIFNGDDKGFSLELITTTPEEENIVNEEPSTTPSLTVSESWVTPYYDAGIGELLEGTEASEIHGDNANTEFNTNSAKLGLEPWKIGLIFTAAFLAVEAVVLVIYFFVCRKRRRAVIAKNCEQDSEAGDTINVESNDNTLAGEEGTINGAPTQHAVSCTRSTEPQEAGQRRVELQGITTDNRSTDV
ncbi:uncharacterized protein O3C94_023222 isoform 1-T1 [Discoglossus pictus]